LGIRFALKDYLNSLMQNFRKLLQNKMFVGTMCVLLFFFLFVQVKNFRTRYAVEKEIAALTEQADQLQKENEELQSFIAYLKTDSYKEKASREQLNMKREGEVVFSFAEDDQQRKDARIEEEEVATQENVSNPTKWWNYFFNHKQS
jgi:cell division protein FtsB